MNLALYRSVLTPQSKIGKLFADGQFFCFSLEDAQAAILAGVFPIELRPSPKFLDFAQTDAFWKPYADAMPHIIGALPPDDPRLNLIMIHPANFWYELDGCVAPGESQGVNCVGTSRPAFQKLYNLIQSALQTPEGCSISIHDAPLQPTMGVDLSSQM